MSFHKVVKAPAKLAHKWNYPHKKSESRNLRIAWLWGSTKTLIGIMLLLRGQKLSYYTQLCAIRQELKELGSYDEQAVACLIRQVKLEHSPY